MAPSIKWSTAVVCCFILGAKASSENADKPSRAGKLLPVFQVVRFPNDPCQVTSGSKNGTCYTTEECSSKGGTKGGSCASGFGVCCVFSFGCGKTISENTSYFESTTALPQGNCRTTVCKSGSDICKIRLDFDSFVITGPSTDSASTTKMLNGYANLPGGQAISQAGECSTDKFMIGNQDNIPIICGTMTGEHVYVEMEQDCIYMDFVIGQALTGVTSAAARTFSIKVTQISCFDDNLPPSGCDQWHFGNSGTGYIKSFNWDGGRHLASQKQTACIRRELNNCRICFSADADADVHLTIATNIAAGVTKGEVCCHYGADGKGLSYDCLIIPGASKKTAATPASILPQKRCGQGKGLITKVGTQTSATICSKSMPFRLEFLANSYENTGAMTDGAKSLGFKLRYFQTAC